MIDSVGSMEEIKYYLYIDKEILVYITYYYYY